MSLGRVLRGNYAAIVTEVDFKFSAAASHVQGTLCSVPLYYSLQGILCGVAALPGSDYDNHNGLHCVLMI